ANAGVLEEVCLTDTQLNRVRSGLDGGGDRAADVLDAGEEVVLVEGAVIDGQVEAFAVGCEEAIQTREHGHFSFLTQSGVPRGKDHVAALAPLSGAMVGIEPAVAALDVVGGGESEPPGGAVNPARGTFQFQVDADRGLIE